MKKTSLLFNITLHGHQPVGNLQDVMESCYEKCYAPVLELLSYHPQIRFSYHLSGCLFEWLNKYHKNHLDLLRTMVDWGQVELIGGAFYEPIIASIPKRDAIAQIKLQQQFIRDYFDTEASGMWIAERVWEPSLPSLIKNAGAEFSLLDDTHFLSAGLKQENLHGYFLTEDQGQLLPIFPILKKLRYSIPFAEPGETINILHEIGEKSPGTMVAYGDDVEKFGIWPETYKLCFENKWLERFLTILEDNLSWIELVSLKEVINRKPSQGLIYLPENSYPEMNEWALPADLNTVFHRLKETVKETPELQKALPFVKGSTWRNFRIKYPEIKRLYGRELHISRKIAMLGDDPAAMKAKQELYKGQCNCPYWHGIFGGHYLPHLREGIWHHLLEAEKIAEEILPVLEEKKVTLEKVDINLDGRDEFYLHNEHLGIIVSPVGGRVIELDLRSYNLNLFSVLGRRKEAYHEKLKEAEPSNSDGTKSIHDIVRLKDPTLAEALYYDQYEHLGLTDLILENKPEPDDFIFGRIKDSHDLQKKEWKITHETENNSIKATLLPDKDDLKIEKRFMLDGKKLDVKYSVTNPCNSEWKGFIAVEIPIALQTGSSPDRVWLNAKGEGLGNLGITLQDEQNSIQVADWDHDLGLFLGSEGSTILTYSIKTISQSEAGFEGVYQHSVAVFLYEINLSPGEDKKWEIRLSVSKAPIREKSHPTLETAGKSN